MPNNKIAPFFTVDIFDDIPGIKHGFFGRQGGVSEGIYKSLNTGKGSDDDPNHIQQSLKIICQTMGISTDQLQTLYQTHSNSVHAAISPATLCEGDGLIAVQPHIALGIKTADCVPVLFACAETKIIGACHAGWGGAFKGIVQNTLTEMITFGAKIDAIHVAIGPCLHQKNFEVGAEFVDQFIQQSPSNADFFAIPHGKTKHHFDIIAYIKGILGRHGIAKVKTCDFDTYSEEELFFSYRRSCHRREPDYGRQLSVILRTE